MVLVHQQADKPITILEAEDVTNFVGTTSDSLPGMNRMASKQRRQAYSIPFKLQVIVLSDMGKGQLKGIMDHRKNNLGIDEEGVGIF